mmetsp:Transcript_37174/g.119492  ORF Transcript_37174/g.119492 Transcript_37174/m.119492 type:complete len:383 (-) Transcript_37174:469-1617(-)
MGGGRDARWLDGGKNLHVHVRVVDDVPVPPQDGLHRVGRVDAVVDHRCGGGGEHVLLGAGTEDGERGGGAHHGGCLRLGGKEARQQRRKQPQVGHQQRHRPVVTPREGAEHVAGDAGVGWERGLLQTGDGAGESADGGLAWRERGVPWLGGDGETRGDVPLLADANHGHRARVARHDAVHNHQPLIQHELERHSPRRKLRRHPRRALAPANLLVVPEAQVHISPRRVAALEQIFDGLQMADHRVLVVDGAAAPYEAVLHLAGPRIDEPLLRIRSGDHVQVSVHHVRKAAGAAAAAALSFVVLIGAPDVDERPVVDHEPVEGGVDAREAPADQLVQFAQLGVQRRDGGHGGGRALRAQLVGIMRDGLAPDCGPEPLRVEMLAV